MTRNFAEATQIVEAFAKHNLPVFSAFYRRQLPRFVKAKELIEAGVIGQVTSLNVMFISAYHKSNSTLNSSWRVQSQHSGGGLFFDLASHALDVIDYMLGPLVDVTGQAANLASEHEVEDIVSLRFNLKNSGAVGAGCWNFAARPHEDQILIHGTQGKIALACFAHPKLTLVNSDGEQTLNLPDPPHVHQPLIQSIVNELNDKGQCPRACYGVCCFVFTSIHDFVWFVCYYTKR